MTRRPGHGGRTVALAAISLSILAIAGAVASDGFIEADAATHLAYARYALHSPRSLTNIWARPLETAIYSAAYAAGGRIGVRFAAIACALACGLIAWRLAISLTYKRPELAAIFTFGQPLFFLYSFTEMTELPFAALFAAAFWAYRRRRWAWMAAAASLLPLGRPEGFGVLLLAAIALIAHCKARWLPILPIPLLLWSYAGSVFDPSFTRHWWTWLIDHWPYAAASDYPPGSLFHFFIELPVLVSPLVLPAMWIGAVLSTPRRLPLRHAARCRLLIAVIPLGTLAVHSWLHWMGKMSSAGEIRYLLIASPFWALLCAAGWQWLEHRLHWREPIAWAAAAVVLPGLINIVTPVVPYVMSPDWESAHRMVDWFMTSPLRNDYPHLVFSHPGIDYYLNRPEDDPIRAIPSSKLTISQNPPGCLLLWNPLFSTTNSDPRMDVTLDSALANGWKPIPLPPRIGGDWRLFLSSRPADSQPR